MAQDSTLIGTARVNIRDINPLEHLTSDLAKARFNYESMLNGLVEWNSSKMDNVTVRLMCDTEPGIVDYTFPTKRASNNMGSNIVDIETGDGAFSYNNEIPISAMISEDTEYNDKIDIRVSVVENGGSKWQLWASAFIYDEYDNESLLIDDNQTPIGHNSDDSTGSLVVSRGSVASMEYLPGQFIRVTHNDDASSEIRWVSAKILPDEQIDGTNTEAVFEEWKANRIHEYSRAGVANHLFVVYKNRVYRPVGSITTRPPSSAGSGWEYFCEVITANNLRHIRLEHGQVYLYVHPCHAGDYSRAELFLYNGDNTSSSYVPYELNCVNECNKCTRVYNDGWVDHSVLLFPITGEFDGTLSYRWTVTTDIESIVIRRLTDGDGSAIPEIYVLPNVRIVGEKSEDNGGLAIFDTSNYSAWPGTSPKWVSNNEYTTDVNRGVYEKQNYTATMVFDHTNPNCKQCNIVNYDGPDLDMGLAIYLPVESTVDGKLSYPKNGRTMEFMFRIWPNPAYNGRETSDMIINKAQIYVYNIPSASDIGKDKTSIGCNARLLAKFSMARLTTFYVFSENIAVPNRPVLYKAKFIYSAEDHEWKTYGYYQIPDCIFLSPSGFVDPSKRADNTYGVETAGFPLMQDPFSNYDLSPVLVDDTFRNRIV